MAHFHDSSNPCFDGSSLVAMADGSTKYVQDLKKGDYVMSGNGSAAKVLCIVKTHCAAKVTELVRLSSGLLITPWHPVRVDGRWHFPQHLGTIEHLACPAVYSLALETQHSIMIGEVECVTLGHGFTEEVVYHPFLGTQEVIKELKRLHGWECGSIEFFDGCMLRSTSCGLLERIDVNKLVQRSESVV
jgi:hypothetical protein